MGLAGRKEKQRIPNDPRNLSWADDANKFGAAYLAKMGWSSGSGLGVNGDGRTTHIKVHQKLDMLGVGKIHQNDPNGIAWKQNHDFENLLRRLNAGDEKGTQETSTKVEGFTKAKDQEEGAEDDTLQESKKRKRHESDVAEEAGNREESKAEKKKNKKDKKKKQGADEGSSEKDKERKVSAEGDEGGQSSAPSSSTARKPTVVAPLRAHRARFLASKRLASKSSAAIDEILGISRSGSTTPYPPTSITSASLDSSSASTPSAEPDSLKLQELTTSSKSVMDYFREKLAAKSNASAASSSTAQSRAPKALTFSDADEPGDYDDRPRGGLGLGFSRAGLGAGPSFTQSSSTLRSEMTFSQEEECERRGIGSSSHFSAMFTSATTMTSSLDTMTENTVEVAENTIEIRDEVEVSERKHKKRKEKKERRDKEQREEANATAEEPSKREKSKQRTDKEKADANIDDLDVSVDKDDEDLSKKHSKKGKRKRDKEEKATEKEEKATEKEDKKREKRKRRDVSTEAGSEGKQKKKGKDS